MSQSIFDVSRRWLRHVARKTLPPPLKLQIIRQLIKLSYHSRLFLNRPHQIELLLNQTCNFRCNHCDIWQAPRATESRPTGFWLKAVGDLHDWLGPFTAYVSGGEPFLRTDLFEIIAALKAHGCYVKLSTNGSLLTAARARSLIAHGVDEAIISLYTLDEEEFRRIRGVDNQLTQVVRNLQQLRQLVDGAAAPLTIKLNVLLTRANAGSIVEVLEFARANRFKAVVQPIRGPHFFSRADSDAYLRSDLWPTDPALVRSLLREISRFSGGGPLLNSAESLSAIEAYLLDQRAFLRKKERCYLPHAHLVVLHDGNVRLCFSDTPIGTLGEQSPREIWHSPLARATRQKLRQCDQTCRVIDWYD